MGIWQAGAAGLLLLQLLIASAFPDLQNPDFELPPTNITKNSTNPFLALDSAISSIPGWSYQGTVKYVVSSSRSQEGNAVYLGENGKINQIFKANEESNHYLLTFNLQPAHSNCTNSTSVTISVPGKSVVVSYKKKFAGNQSSWQTHGVYLGIHGNGELINLTLENQASRQTSNNTVMTKCDVLLDSFILKNISNPVDSSEDSMLLNSGFGLTSFLINAKNNLLLNGGFEYGPAFPNNSSGGILIDAESNPTESPIYNWAILGTVKYITNYNYSIPEGNAAIELVSGKSSGIQTTVTLKKGSKYDMEIFTGHYNELCIGELAVRIKIGSDEFYRPIGRAENYQRIIEVYRITVESSVTSISIRSEATTETKDGVLCGPAIDRIVLLPYSYGLKLQISVLFVCLASFLVIFTQLIG